MTGAHSASTAARHFADWSARLRLEDVAPPVRRAVGRHLLDGLGTTLAAARLGAARPAVTVARGLGGPAQASILGTGDRIGAAAAALANGAQIHALDFDDTHAGGLVHATAVVLPAVFAVGEEVEASGADTMLAAAVGLETVCRLGAVTPHAFHARGLHATAVCGVFAAALAAARLYRLDPERTVHALGIAGSQAGGLLEFLNTGASTKQLHPGFASQAGIMAARLAQAGATGPASVLEGEYGLYAALVGTRVDPSALTDGLGQRWEATRITIKPYPVCQLSHAALDAVRRLQLDGADPATDIAEITADVHPDAAQVVCAPGKEEPRTAYDAKFSMPWCVARLLLHGELTEDAFARIDDPQVLELAARFRHRVVDFPGVAADQPGVVRVRLRDGRSLHAHVSHSSGGPDDPGIEELVRTKAIGNIGAGPASERLADRVLDLAAQTDLKTVLADIAAIVHEPDWGNPQ
ncbi:MAG: MmgE/PrpD family protein [Nocardiopsaceae bacterium]|mgnify:CR=1 FL=1|nr:MmgE/PrpD family protein [Nocardiopsaceae bacterium]